MKYVQFHIPASLEELADNYPQVTWQTALRLYRDAVVQVLISSCVEVITDIPKGYGFAEAAKVFKDKIAEHLEKNSQNPP